MQRESMLVSSVYDTVKSNPSSMHDPSQHVMEYISKWFSMSVVFTLKDILGKSIFVYVVSEERRNNALNAVDILILS